MGDVVRFKKTKLKDKHRGNTLCGRGFHKWEVDKKQPFAVQQGKLRSTYRCTRCGAIKTKAE